jgi:hypothetical protein
MLGLRPSDEHRAFVCERDDRQREAGSSSRGGPAGGRVPMTGKAMIRLLALSLGMVVLACSDAGMPAEPSNSLDPQLSVASDSAHVRHDVLKQELENRKAYFKQQREANRDALRTARAEWRAWKENWKEQYKAEREAWKREHPGEKGGPDSPDVELMRCEPRDYTADAAIIGPNGGTLHVGPHELVIPKGALDHEELIVAEAPTSSLVDVRFSPSGLQFLKPAQLKLSYHGCVRPTSADLLVAYLGWGNQILELPPSVDLRSDDEVEAEIGHFSRYAIAY